MIYRILFYSFAVMSLGNTAVSTSSYSISQTTIASSPSPSHLSSVVSPSTSVIQPSSPHVSTSVVSPTQSLASVSMSPTHSLASVSMSSSMKTSSAVHPSPTTPPVTDTIAVPKDNPCLRAVLDVTFDVEYEKKETANKTVVAKAEIPLTGDLALEVVGNCSYFTVKWNENKTAAHNHSFSMYFEENSALWNLKKVSVRFDTNDSFGFPNATESFLTGDCTGKKCGIAEDNKVGQAYICNGGLKLNLGNTTKAVFKEIKLQPFSNKTITDGKHCSADKHKKDDDDDNTVPIAVGAALGGLVLIVLVAYIIGRRRSNRGYEQV